MSPNLYEGNEWLFSSSPSPAHPHHLPLHINLIRTLSAPLLHCRYACLRTPGKWETLCLCAWLGDAHWLLLQGAVGLGLLLHCQFGAYVRCYKCCRGVSVLARALQGFVETWKNMVNYSARNNRHMELLILCVKIKKTKNELRTKSIYCIR